LPTDRSTSSGSITSTVTLTPIVFLTSVPAHARPRRPRPARRRAGAPPGPTAAKLDGPTYRDPGPRPPRSGDAGRLDEAGELFTADATYDLDDFGGGSLHGTAAIRAAALAVGDANPVGHHVTNIVITAIDDRTAQVRSKGIGIKADGTAGSVVYDDIVTRQPGGWRISYRKVTGKRAPLGKQQAGPRTVLQRLRQAAISQSTEDMNRLYAVDAVHEFPFTAPGLPSRLDRRDEIVNWIAAGWAANPLKYERYRTVAIHDTSDPETIIVEQQALGAGASTGEFALPSVLVLTVRNGQIAHLRDYVNIPAAAAAIGRDIA
jgi:ketosteroid isomerase-like protein